MGKIPKGVIAATLQTARTQNNAVGQRLAEVLGTSEGELIVPEPKGRAILQTALGLSLALELCLTAVDDSGDFRLPAGYESELAFALNLSKRYHAASPAPVD